MGYVVLAGALMWEVGYLLSSSIPEGESGIVEC